MPTFFLKNWSWKELRGPLGNGQSCSWWSIEAISLCEICVRTHLFICTFMYMDMDTLLLSFFLSCFGVWRVLCLLSYTVFSRGNFSCGSQKTRKGLWSSTATSLSRNHDPVTQNNPQTLLGTVSRGIFFLYHHVTGNMHLLFDDVPAHNTFNADKKESMFKNLEPICTNLTHYKAPKRFGFVQSFRVWQAVFSPFDFMRWFENFYCCSSLVAKNPKQWEDSISETQFYVKNDWKDQ